MGKTERIILFLLLGIFLVSFASAAPLEKIGFDFDNIEQFTKDITTSKYGKYEIRNSILGLSWFQYGKVADIELKQNSDRCSEDCFAEKEITLYHDGILIDEIIFKTLQKDGSWVEQQIRSYSFSYMNNGIRVNYVEGEVVEAGTYTLRLDGKKKPSRTVDWVIKSNGIWTDEWQIWGGETEIETTTDLEGITGQSAKSGIKINITENIRIIEVEKFNTTTATKAYIQYENETIIATADFSDDKAIFDVELSTEEDYRIVVDNDGSGYSITGTTSPDAYPFVRDDIIVTGSVGINPVWLGSIHNVTYLTLVGDIALNSPVDEFISSNNNIGFNCSSNVTGGATLVNISLWTNETGSFELRNVTTGLSGSSTSQEWNRTLSDGSYLWNCRACNSDGDCGFAVENRTVFLDISAPTITVESPTGILDHNYIGGNETLNVTFTDLGLDSCWYNYNGTNITIDGCLTGIKNSTTFILEVNNLNMTIYTNDTAGNENSTFSEWDYTVLEINQTFNNQTIEGAAEDFSAIIKLGPGETISAVVFVYNESATAGVSSAIGNNTEITLENFIIPQVITETNITFHWSIILTGGEIINITSQNQTVKNMDIDNCSTFTNQILNLSMVDEEEQTPLSNTTIEVAINLLSVDRTKTVVSLSGNFEDENPLGICLDENVTEGITYSLDAIIKYTATGYAIEYYNIVNLSLNNETGIRKITLYNLNASDSTDFQLTFNGEDFLPVEDALVFVERQYIAENIFKTVELPKTDSNGQTILHLVRNDIIYNIRVVKDGLVLANFLNIIAFCQDFTIGDCTLPLNAQSNTTGIFNYDDEVGILYDSPPIYTAATGLVSFDFISTSGATKIVLIDVERRDIFGNNSVCSNTLVSTSGTVSCNAGTNLSDTLLFTTITIDGEEWIADTTQIDKTNFGSIGFVMWFILSITLLLMFAESKNGVMLSVAISYIGAVTLGLSTGTITGIGSAGVWVLVITSIGIWKINKNRRS